MSLKKPKRSKDNTNWVANQNSSMFAELVLDVKRSKWSGLKVRKPYKNISPSIKADNIGTI